MNEYVRYVFGLEVVLLIFQWGRFRLPMASELIDHKRKGYQNILFRQMLHRLHPPAWAREVMVIADAGFASRANLRLVIRLGWRFAFALPRTWKLEDGMHSKTWQPICQRTDIGRSIPISTSNALATFSIYTLEYGLWNALSKNSNPACTGNKCR
jgi:Transposase DDE domain